jgi:hypothetical protein
MKTETALTAFCITTVMLIVGLVLLTAHDLQLIDTPITGEAYLGIPRMGQVSREPLPLTLIEVDPRDPDCYQKGVKECGRLNAGKNFVLCTDRVGLDCGAPHALLAQCFLPAGFELKYLTKRECYYGVIDECKVRCAAGMVNSCVELSKSRCELIGGKFQDIREQTRKTAYPVGLLQIR